MSESPSYPDMDLAVTLRDDRLEVRVLDSPQARPATGSRRLPRMTRAQPYSMRFPPGVLALIR